jgi:two-component system, NarL family, invasion response regulator UvrY
MAINLVLVDDHILLRNGLADLLKNKGYNILFQASNGKEFIDNLLPTHLPDIVLMDINMPIMDGFETTLWLTKNHPDIKVIALSMYDAEDNIIKMIRNGARGYVLKYAEADELINAIDSIAKSGFYYSDLVNHKLVNSILSASPHKQNSLEKIIVTDKEVVFLKLCCTEMTFKEIADTMNLSPKTIDRYREILFDKLNIHSRVGLAMYAVKSGLV